MDFIDGTKNQHFVAQVEQRQHAINPNAEKHNQKIYSFTVTEREQHKVALDSSKGSIINKNMSISNLFSFDKADRNTNYNFEKIFGKYEEGIEKYTEGLLSKIRTDGADVAKEATNIFALKFLNSLRNPYSIKKTLNTFSELRNMKPTNQTLLDNFERVLNGKKPQQERLCRELGISKREYKEWLATLFLLLAVKEGKANMLEQMIAEMFSNPSSCVIINVFIYDEEVCLLSDRAFSTPFPDDANTILNFNLTSQSYIQYAFLDVKSFVDVNRYGGAYGRYEREAKRIKLYPRYNDLEKLKEYNHNVIYQCHKNVFCSRKDYYGSNMPD